MPEELFLSQLLEAYRSLSEKIDTAMERMATREDLAALRSDLRETVGTREFEVTISVLAGRVSSLESQVAGMRAAQLPPWFWSRVGMLCAALPAITSFILHYWR